MSNNSNTAELVRRAQGGDSAAFNQLFNSCYNDIYYFALKTVKKEDLAYDITQEACIDIFKNISSLQDPNMFVAWSKRITYNRCAQYFRKNHELLVDENEDGSDIFDAIEDEDGDFIPAEALDKEDFRKTIMEMINNLSEEQRTAVMLYYFDELSISEIAEIQGVSEGTVKSRLNYARKAIKSAVEDYEEKNDVKLHSFGLLPLLLWLRGGDMAGLSIPAASSALHGALASGLAASAGSTAASTVAATAAASASKGIAAKIIAAVVAVSVAVTGGVVAYKEIKKRTERPTTETQESTETTDRVSSNHQKPSVEELPEDFTSENLEVYGSSYDFRGQIVKYITNTASYFVTTDGSIYSTDDASAPVGVALSPDYVYTLYNGLAYINEEGKLVGDAFNVGVPLPSPDHQVVDVYSTGLLSSYVDMITMDSTGNLYYTSYVKEDMSVVFSCAPIVVYDSSTEAMGSRVVDIEICYNDIYDDDYVYVVTEDMIYLTNVRELSDDGSLVFYGTPVTDTVGGIIPTLRSEDDYSPIYIKDGNDTNIYRYKDGTLSGGEVALPLPEGYVASQVELVIPAYHTWIIAFSDGSVYTCGGFYDMTYTRIDYLSDLYADGLITDFYALNQNIWNEDFDIIIWMSDNGLYKYNP